MTHSQSEVATSNTATHSGWAIYLSHWCESHYKAMMAICLIIAALLRFWGLDAVPQAYFDEINVPQFGWAMLNHKADTPFVTAHPPLTHYLFALSIWFYYLLPGVDGSWTQAWAEIDPMSYRWLTAAFGVACVFFAGDWLRRLSGNALAGLLLALFVAIDASLVVDSRAGLNNIVMLALGLMALWCWQLAADRHWTWGWLVAAGVSLGSVVAVKWNGLGFWLVIVALLALSGLRWLLDYYRPLVGQGQSDWQGPTPIKIIVCLVLLPALTYWLWWQPYLALEHKGFLEIHQLMGTFHTQEVGANDHPYCSAWYQWPWQGRPMSYLFELQPELGNKVYRVIHQLGNPALYPIAFVASLWLAWLGLCASWRWFTAGLLCSSAPVIGYLVLGVTANFLPWMLVHRCLFSYHYQPASVFSFGALAWLLSQAFTRQRTPGWRTWLQWSVCGLVLVLIVAAFVYWLPLAVGAPIALDQFYQRMWLKGWI